MSQLLPGVHLVDGVGLPGRPGTLNVVLLVADDRTATLIDAGFPGIAEKLSATLAEAGLQPSAVKRVIATHHHLDHTSGLPEVVALTGAEVWAHADDADLIDGTTARPTPMPQGMSPARVDLRLVGGERLEALGGVHILHTPGHTPGHLSILVPQLSLLIAGDILRYEGGVVTRAPAEYTADAEANEGSIRALAALEFERMLPYHGQFLPAEAGTRLRRDLELN
jgi:glyoxylase-like metal-dependent hydrolase (beta-lactamase superfamily II)